MTVRDEADTPLDGLPPSVRVVLRGSQLELVLVEVRYASARVEITSDEALAFAEALKSSGVSLPQLSPAQQQQVTVNVTPAGPQSEVTVQTRGWQLAAADNSTVVAFLPEALVVQTTRYEHWSVSLAPVLDAALRAAADVLSPSLVQRLGLRYVNRFVDVEAGTPAAWLGRIDENLLGVVRHPELGSRVRGTQQQIELSLGGAQGALIRHGLFQDGAARGAFSYLIDLDVFDAHSAAFRAADLSLAATTLNRTAMALFRQLVTEPFLEQLNPETSDIVAVAPDDAVAGGDETGVEA